MKTAKNAFFIRIAVLFSLLGTVAGCAFLGETAPLEEPAAEESEAPPATSKVAIQDLAESKSKVMTDVEVVWQVPEEPVEGYVIRYGYSREAIDQEVRVKSSDLEKFEDKTFGNIYRYVLASIPAARPVFISISAYEGSTVSEPSKIFEVK